MMTFTLYLLKVMICSGILFAYYHLALRNKIFHKWNRFYLLASVIISLILPVMKINVWRDAIREKGTVVQMLETITTGDEIIIEYGNRTLVQTISENLVMLLYTAVSVMLVSLFLISLLRILKLKRSAKEKILEGIHFVPTEANGTPFSFFNYIFWNNKIDLHSAQGQRILNHELVHVRTNILRTNYL